MEKKILCYLIKNPEDSTRIDDAIFPSDKYRGLFCVIKDKALKQSAVTPEFLAEDSRCKISLHDIQDIVMNFVSKAEFEEYVKRLTKKKQLSFFDKLFHKYFQKFSEAKINDKLGVLINLKEELIKSNTTSKSYIVHGKEMYDEWLEKYGKPIKYKAKFGIPKLDKEIGGLRGTELVIVVADTGLGKTNLLLNFVHNMLKQNKKILFFSLEMGVDELLDRFIPIAGNTNAEDIRERATQKQFLQSTIDNLKKNNLKIISDGDITSDDVVNEMINQKPDVVFVDYLQRLADVRGTGSEMERLRSIAQKLKNGALKLKIPVITPAQVDKASSLSGSYRIENVAGAKDIANEADIGLYLFKDKMTEKQAELCSIVENTLGDSTKKQSNTLKLKIVKSRHSRDQGIIDLNFDKNNLMMTQLYV